MIKQDKTPYQEYVSSMREKIKKLSTDLPGIKLAKSTKQEIEEMHKKLAIELALLEVVTKQKSGIIYPDDFGKHKQKINNLYDELKTKVNQVITTTNSNQEKTHTKQKTR